MSVSSSSIRSGTATPTTGKLDYLRNRVPFFTPNSSAKMAKGGAMSGSSSSIASSENGSRSRGLPMSVVFDDIMRHFDHYNNYGCENEFLEFINSSEASRKKWAEALDEVERGKIEKQKLKSEIQRQEKIMADFRIQFDTKLEILSRLQTENNVRKGRMNSAVSLCKRYMNDARIQEDSKNKISNILAALEGMEQEKNRVGLVSPGRGLDTISEAETTDMSGTTQSEDTLDNSASSPTTRRRNRRNKRRSTEMGPPSRKKFHVSQASGHAKQVISQTIVSIPKDGGPVHAMSTLETVPGRSGNGTNGASHYNGQSVQPSAPPMTGTSESESEPNQFRDMKPPAYSTRSSFKVNADAQQVESPRFGRTLSATSGRVNHHAFLTKTVIKPETCGVCEKRIKFTKVALKCKNCNATCHPECGEKVPIPCVSSSTPSKRIANGQLGILADYTPATHPMVPALIQHCVNEIEIRALNVVGLYRVPGSEREVKALKERFLRGKGVPNLSNIDPHVICGCVKDFLRSLKEPLIGRWFWRPFALATEISDPIKRQAEFHRTLDELPPPNQDTLAFLILHLQRVAEIEEIKMPLSNMAKIFGPAIIGYSTSDLDANTMLKETKKQQGILEALLSMSADYWRQFNNRGQGEQENLAYTRPPRKRFSSVGRAKGNAITSTPISNKTSSATKKIYFTDASPEEPRQILRPKRNYFD